MDGITELSCKNGITHYGVDAWEATHNGLGRRFERCGRAYWSVELGP